MFAVIKQLVVIVILSLIGIGIWGARDPGARDRLIGFGIPEKYLPIQAFLTASPAGGPDAKPTEATERKGQAGQGQGGQGQAGQGQGGQGQGRDRPAGAGPGGRDAGPALVVTGTVSAAVTNDRATAIGTSEAIRSIILFPRASGVILSNEMSAGKQVTEGAVLLRLDDAAERLALSRAEIAVKDAEAQLERSQKLAANKSITAVALEAAQSALATALIERQVAQLSLDQRAILAPFSGILGIPSVQTGMSITPTTALVTLDDRTRLNLTFRIPEAFAARVQLGQTVDALTVSRPGETFTATVTALGSQIEPDSRTLVVQAALDNAADMLRPGMSFFLTLHFTGEPALSVPALAVQWDRDGSYVWRVAGGKVERVAASIVERNRDTVLVRGELAVGDAVVVEGLQRLRPGAAVTTPDAPATATTN